MKNIQGRKKQNGDLECKKITIQNSSEVYVHHFTPVFSCNSTQSSLHLFISPWTLTIFYCCPISVYLKETPVPQHLSRQYFRFSPAHVKVVRYVLISSGVSAETVVD